MALGSRKIRIRHTAIAEDLTDFQLYVRLSDLGAHFWGNVASGGGDIRMFASDGTTELAREVVSCDTSAKTGELWVKVPAVSASVDTVVFIAYGSGAADYAPTDTYGAQAVWGANAKYVGHFEGDADDSSASGNDGAVTGATQVDGEIGKAYDFAVLDTDNVTVPNLAAILTQLGTFQINCKVYLDANGSNRNVWNFGGGSSNRINLVINAVNAHFSRYNGSGYIAKSLGGLSLLNGWHNIICKNNGGTMTLKVDDVTATNTTNAYVVQTNTNLLSIGYPGSTQDGSGSMDGKIDEFRVLSSLTSDDYDSAEYANQSDPGTFYVVERVKTLNGVAIASVKTINGVATGSVKSINGSS